MKRHLTVWGIAVLMLVLAMGFLPVQVVNATTPIYVDASRPDDTGNGESWATAKKYIQSGIDIVDSPGTVHVAAGTYNENITLKDGVEVLGAGEAVTTIDGGGLGTVVTAISVGLETKLDGFTITNGYTPNNSGGMYNENSSPTVTNCTFSGNTAVNDGGGIYNNGSSPIFTNCTFSGNSAYSGSGIYNYYSLATLSNCTFSGNTAYNAGGGMYNNGSSPMLTNCTFSGNSADDGGGMHNDYSSNPTLTNCTFSGNSADYGGGMCNKRNSSSTVTYCTFSGNSADWGGGGTYDDYSSNSTFTNCTFSGNSAYSGGAIYNNWCSPTITNCTFYGNTADSSGGGMCISFASPTITNCTFYGNTADSSGGGIYNLLYSAPTITNCTFYGNTADSSGGGIYNFLYSAPTITNCILWEDTINEIFNSIDSSTTVSYCDIQGGYADAGNIDQDPLFVDPDNGDFHLQYGSSCIDSGTNSAPFIPAEDFEGDDRPLDGDGDHTATADMGVDEYLLRIDLEISKTDEPDPVIAGEVLTYTLTVINKGREEAENVSLTENIPAELGDVEYSTDNGATWTDWAGPYTLDLGAIGSWDEKVVLVRGTVDSGTAEGSVIVNEAGVSTSSDDPNPANDSASQETAVDTLADLEVVKTGCDRVLGGGSLIYTITVTNHGPSDATGVEVTDVLPAGLSYQSCYAGEGSAVECGGTVTWDGFGLAAGESAVLTIETVAAVQMTDRVIANEAVAVCDQTDPNEMNNNDVHGTLVYSPRDTVGGEVAPLSRWPLFVWGLSSVPILAAAFFIFRLARRRTG